MRLKPTDRPIARFMIRIEPYIRARLCMHHTHYGMIVHCRLDEASHSGRSPTVPSRPHAPSGTVSERQGNTVRASKSARVFQV